MTDTKMDIGAWIMRLALIALGAAIMIGGIGYRIFEPTGLVGAGFVPFVAGLIMVLAGVWEGVTAFRSQKGAIAVDQPDVASAGGVLIESATAETVVELLDTNADGVLQIVGTEGEGALAGEEELDVFGRSEAESKRAVIYVFLVLLITTVLASVIGLLLSLAVMVFVLLKFVERKSWIAAIVGAALAFLFGYVVFGMLLGVPLPTGMLGIV